MIKAAEAGKSHRKLAEEFGIGKTQVGSILKRKRETTEAYKRNEPASKRNCTYTSSNDDLNSLMWQWFSRARAQNLPVPGPSFRSELWNMPRSWGKRASKLPTAGSTLLRKGITSHLLLHVGRD